MDRLSTSKHLEEKYQKNDIRLARKIYEDCSNDEKILLLDYIDGGKINSRDVAIIRMTLAKIKKDVITKLRPYVRNTDKIVYYCPSKNKYKAYIPKALLKEDTAVPQCAVSEYQMWYKLYTYLYGDYADATLEYLAELWFKERKKDLDVSSKTYDRNKNTWDKYFKDNPIVKIPVRRLTANKFYLFYKAYTAGRAITRAELNNIKGIPNMVLDYAVNNEIIEHNVARDVSTKSLKCKIVNNKDKVYTPEERAALFEYLISIPQNVYTLGIMLMFCLDIRIGELKALKWSDYDESKGQIYIQRQIVDRKDENGKWFQLELDYTKGGEDGDRWLPISKTAKHLLTQLKLLSNNKEYILINRGETTIKTNKFNEHLQKYCHACGIRYLSSHKIRFYAVTEQAKIGMDLATIQYRSGHKCKTTTLHYIRNASINAVCDEKWESVFG